MADEAKPDASTDPDGGGSSTPLTAPVTKDGTATTTDGGKKVTFDADQQVFIQSLVDDMFGKGFGRAKKEFEPKLNEATQKVTDLSKQLETLQAQLTAAKSDKGKDGVVKDEPKGEVKPNERELQQVAKIEELMQAVEMFKSKSTDLQTQLEQANKATSSARMRDDFIKALPPGIKFVDINDAFELVMREGMLRQDETGTLVVIDHATNEPKRVKSTFEFMTPSEYIADFAARKAHLVEDTTGGGTGAGSSTVVRTDKVGKSYKDLSRDEFRAVVDSTKAMA